MQYKSIKTNKLTDIWMCRVFIAIQQSSADYHIMSYNLRHRMLKGPSTKLINPVSLYCSYAPFQSAVVALQQTRKNKCLPHEPRWLEEGLKTRSSFMHIQILKMPDGAIMLYNTSDRENRQHKCRIWLTCLHWYEQLPPLDPSEYRNQHLISGVYILK